MNSKQVLFLLCCLLQFNIEATEKCRFEYLLEKGPLKVRAVVTAPDGNSKEIQPHKIESVEIDYRPGLLAPLTRLGWMMGLRPIHITGESASVGQGVTVGAGFMSGNTIDITPKYYSSLPVQSFSIISERNRPYFFVIPRMQGWDTVAGIAKQIILNESNPFRMKGTWRKLEEESSTGQSATE